jgi:hypothetical protein
MTKLIIATGYFNGSLNDIEVLDLSPANLTCKNLPNLPLRTYYAMGGLYDQRFCVI